jgi:hypothetical protein
MFIRFGGTLIFSKQFAFTEQRRAAATFRGSCWEFHVPFFVHEKHLSAGNLA